ncbi:hypothetical protein XFEB_00304 [Xylella fastidiosa EB92.1]|nr:hypothetical protein XFEB_00304 [Xylella fastidiosa EB92.1]
MPADATLSAFLQVRQVAMPRTRGSCSIRRCCHRRGTAGQGGQCSSIIQEEVSHRAGDGRQAGEVSGQECGSNSLQALDLRSRGFVPRATR